MVNSASLDSLPRVQIYTDGSCLGNPGPGAYGAVLKYGDHLGERSAGYQFTTNNRMEIMSAIVGVEALTRRCLVTVYSDSQCLVRGMGQGWAQRWRANGWRLSVSGRAKNPDLWERLLDACAPHKVSFEWARGHSGDRLNERCHLLAEFAARGEALTIDDGYATLVA